MRTRLLDFGIANEDAWSVGLSCGGRIQVFVEPVSRMKPDVLSAILEAKRAKVPVALLTQLRTGEQIAVGPASVSHDTELDPGAITRGRELLVEDRSERFDSALGASRQGGTSRSRHKRRAVTSPAKASSTALRVSPSASPLNSARAACV